MKHWPVLSVVLALAACSTPAKAPVDPATGALAVRELLTQAADRAVNRLGRPDGYYGEPRLRIPLPGSLARHERSLRRYGLERYAEDFTLSMNRAAEAAMPAAKPVLLAAVQELSLADAAGIVRGTNDAATRYFRALTEAALNERLRPIVAEATARNRVTAAYKRLLKRVAAFDRTVGVEQFDLDAYVTREALDGVYRAMAEEEARMRTDPLARPAGLLRKVLR